MSALLWASGVPTASDVAYWSSFGVTGLVSDLGRLWRLGGQHFDHTGDPSSPASPWVRLPETCEVASSWDVYAGMHLVNDVKNDPNYRKPLFAWQDNDWRVLLDSFREAGEHAYRAGAKGFAFDGELSYAGGGDWPYTQNQELPYERGLDVAHALTRPWAALLRAPLLYCYHWASHTNGLYAEQTLPSYRGLHTDMAAFARGLNFKCVVTYADDVFYKTTHNGSSWPVAYERARALFDANARDQADGYAPMLWLDSDGTGFGELPISVEQVRHAGTYSVNSRPVWYVWAGVSHRLDPATEATIRAALDVPTIPPTTPPVEPQPQPPTVPAPSDSDPWAVFDADIAAAVTRLKKNL